MNPQLFTERSLDWLLHSPIRGSDGSVYSWVNPQKPGYVYPEIMGYYLKTLTYFAGQNPTLLKKATPVADAIIRLIPDGIGRAGITYAFDAAMCLSGLIAFARATDTRTYDKSIGALTQFLVDSLSSHIVAFANGKPLIDLDKWSLSFGASTLKTCISLIEASEYLRDPQSRGLAERITKEIIDTCFKTDHFTINPQRFWVYTHPHCYAVEGLLFLRTKGYDHTAIITKAADWLAAQQNADGSLFDWYERSCPKNKQGDATAQSLRIWLLTDRKKYQKNIENAFRFLSSLQAPSGGIAYQKGSEDINSWVTMFSCQAADWTTKEGSAAWIV